MSGWNMSLKHPAFPNTIWGVFLSLCKVHGILTAQGNPRHRHSRER